MGKTTKKQRGGNAHNIAGQGFHTNPERINRAGRKPLLIRDLVNKLHTEGYEKMTAGELTDCYTALLNLDERRLKDIMSDSKTPYFLRLLIKNMNTDRFLEVIDRIVDRSFGRSKQHVEISEVDAPDPTIANKSEEDLLQGVDKRMQAIDIEFETSNQNGSNENLLGQP